MRHLSIRLKVTLWFMGALILMVAVTCTMILYVSDQIIQKGIRDSLIETVENNVDEVEYFDSLEGIDLLNDVDYFILYGSGFLEIDDDFLDEVNKIYTSLYDGDLNMMYGENPIAGPSASVPLSDSVVKTVKVNGTVYYIFDRVLTSEGVEGLWLRGVVSETQGKNEMSSIFRLSLVLLPLLVIIIAAGGYMVTKKMLSPIERISESAARISKGKDLKQRIEIGSGSDELHKLADSFNDMFERLNGAFEAERQFTSDASHELRTPMAVIMAQCELTLEKERTPEEYEKALSVIQRQGNKMSKLINDMLDFTRLETRAESYKKEELDFSALTASVCSDMALIKTNGIELSCSCGSDITIFGNKELLSRLITNLVSNAYRYGKENGYIKVKLEETDTEIKLSVADNGIGVADDERNKIFRRFYQADNSRSGVGTGLGLSMAAEIASFHGGEISVESKVGEGSIFTVVFEKK